METEETGRLQGWKQKRKGGCRDGNRRERESEGMETEEKGSLEEWKQKRKGAWRYGKRRDMEAGGIETKGDMMRKKQRYLYFLLCASFVGTHLVLKCLLSKY